MNPTDITNNNNVTRDELAKILELIYNNSNGNNNNRNGNNNNSKHINNNVRIPSPMSYDGSRILSIIDNWYTSVERYLRFNNFDESRWVEYSVTLLSGRALLWYNRVTLNNLNTLPLGLLLKLL